VALRRLKIQATWPQAEKITPAGSASTRSLARP
jgi:hypothetical protein